MSPITAFRLVNGLQVLISEVQRVPAAVCSLWYRVGARLDGATMTGRAHWVEHMLFSGTPRFPKGVLKRSIARRGGMSYGATAHDFTVFYSTVPTAQLDRVFELEADRMRNVIFDHAEVERERKVIIAEREAAENQRAWVLREAVLATAIPTHPYGQRVIGSKADLRRINPTDLIEYYRQYYNPNNAVLVIVGDVHAETLRTRIEATFGHLLPGPHLDTSFTPEYPQEMEREVSISALGTTSVLDIVYHAASSQHSDYAALVVLDALLTGAKRSRFSDGPQLHRSSRLYRALRESQLATSIRSRYTTTAHPYLLEFVITPNRRVSPDMVTAALFTELAMLQQNRVSAEELAIVQRQLRAQAAYAQERLLSQAWLMGVWAMMGQVTRSATYLDEVSAVNADAVRHVAQRYLTPAHRTIGLALPVRTE